MDPWRDEAELPLSELSQAMASYSADGQVDDATGGDAGAEEEFGEEPVESAAEVVDGLPSGERSAGSPPAGDRSGDPDPDSEEGRRLRPSPDGHPGPN
jgi:hypothetical protein